MSGSDGEPPLRRRVERFYPPVLLAIPTLALAFLGPETVVLAIPVALGGLALSTFLRRLAQSWAVDLWAVPALVGTGVVAVLSGASLPSEMLAAAAALAALYWIATDPPGARLPANPVSGLLLPGLAVSLAIAVTLFLPSGPALVGVASVILVALFLGLAAVLAAWSSEDLGDGHAQEAPWP